ncbi:unnamed protein product [Spirodela intermedia]|uniref:Uncharacterized protein n=1 Tax=Spirodela intermedia TaxID=51605 RepID=A0ABN7EAR9_SPIIN|nr:unnamed protein product [Spirodela intermedia]
MKASVGHSKSCYRVAKKRRGGGKSSTHPLSGLPQRAAAGALAPLLRGQCRGS